MSLSLSLTVTGLGLSIGLIKYWSWSHTFWSRGLKSIICSSHSMTSDCVLIILVSGHYKYFTSEYIVIIINYSLFIISNM